MESSSQDRNLPATERKLQQARRDGQVSRSRDLGHLAVIAGGGALIWYLGRTFLDSAKTGLAQHLVFSARGLGEPTTMVDRFGQIGLFGAALCVALGLGIGLLAILCNWAVGGWVYSFKPLAPDFSRISPFSGIKRLFSKEHLSETIKLSFLAVVLGAVAFHHLVQALDGLMTYSAQSPNAAIRDVIQWIAAGLGLLLLPLLIAAIVDVPLQIHFGKARLRMSHEEVKQEHKESDGNPQVKGRLRARQREIANRNSVKSVPKADLVLMNPTHFAVALRYDEASMTAPRVVSKGADLLALHIRDIARAHRVPVLQSPILARALYTHAELNREIPGTLYTAVAQVLAYVYRLRLADQGEGPMPGEFVQPYVDPALDPLTTKQAEVAA